jgi:hypothetical protein
MNTYRLLEAAIPGNLNILGDPSRLTSKSPLLFETVFQLLVGRPLEYIDRTLRIVYMLKYLNTLFLSSRSATSASLSEVKLAMPAPVAAALPPPQAVQRRPSSCN